MLEKFVLETESLSSRLNIMCHGLCHEKSNRFQYESTPDRIVKNVNKQNISKKRVNIVSLFCGESIQFSESLYPQGRVVNEDGW